MGANSRRVLASILYLMLFGRRAAYFAIIGFAVVLFIFFGVTYLLPGLHAYS